MRRRTYKVPITVNDTLKYIDIKAYNRNEANYVAGKIVAECQKEGGDIDACIRQKANA